MRQHAFCPCIARASFTFAIYASDGRVEPPSAWQDLIQRASRFWRADFRGAAHQSRPFAAKSGGVLCDLDLSRQGNMTTSWSHRPGAL